MNEAQIEILLRKVPAMRVPEGLLGRLTSDIRLPPQETGGDWREPEPWFKRWMPAISFAVILLGCLVALAVQTGTLTDLKEQNKILRDATANLDGLRAENAEFKRLTLENGELDRLRKDNAELEKLRGDVAQMQGQLQGAAQLQAENQRLKALLAAPAQGVVENSSVDDALRAEAERVSCVNNLKQVGLAARIWAGDNNGVYPTNFIAMTNELTTWKILQCPSDKARGVSNWDDVANGNVSYQIVGPGATDDHQDQVFAICPVHGTLLMVDGSVQYIGVSNLQTKLKAIDGKTYWRP